MGAQGLSSQPVGSLEALRATWNTAVHGPLGNTLYQQQGSDGLPQRLNGLQQQHSGPLPR